MTKTGMYIGPEEFIRRYMAGFNVKADDYLKDGSPFVRRFLPRGHIERLTQIAPVKHVPLSLLHPTQFAPTTNEENTMPKKTTFKTDIVLGEKYRDAQTGFVGHATAVYFFQHGCERVQLKALIQGELKEYVFDAPELESVATGLRATSPRTGGPHDRTPVAR